MKKAFTLIELLICLAIISITAAILFPIFNQARINTLKINSISSIRQIGLAWKMYSEDYDDVLMRKFYDYQHWFGNQNDSVLQNYINLKNAKDPLAFIVYTAPKYWNGYGYNGAYLSPYDNNLRPIPITYQQIENPSQTIVFGTVAGLFIVNNKEELYPMAEIHPPSYYFPTFHARYLNKGIVLWADLHTTVESPKNFLFNKKYINNNLGFIDKDNNPNTDELFDLN